MKTTFAVHAFVERQLQCWPDAHQRHEALHSIWHRTLTDEKYTVPLEAQYNPSRIVSTGASISKEAIAQRPCFLCAHHRPAEQLTEVLDEHFEWLINPFPILPSHLTIVSKRHQPQRILPAYSSLIEATRQLPDDFIVFYNGPFCGASAPDHLHLQAGQGEQLPLIRYIRSLQGELPTVIAPWGYKIYLIAQAEKNDAFLQLYHQLPILEGEDEPRLNLIAFHHAGHIALALIPRRAHRPHCYTAEGEAQMLISPGAIDMCGLLITPRATDYERLTSQRAQGILCEVGVRNEPTIDVGILQSDTIHFTLHDDYTFNGRTYQGAYTVTLHNGQLLWEGTPYTEIVLKPTNAANTFSLHQVTIGKAFHWQQEETQTFHGALKLMLIDGHPAAINHILIEDYLTCVIASEMKATSSVELLKAHAIISRSWLLAQLQAPQHPSLPSSSNEEGLSSSEVKQPSSEGLPAHIVWYDREGHHHFDVCADDHCQRYQGISRATTPAVFEAIRATRGMVLSYEGEVCDARFSKCCGGISERYDSCWDASSSHPYLSVVRDGQDEHPLPDLTDEKQAETWIRTSPPAFCNTHDAKTLSEVLNAYDTSTPFYRWTVTYTQDELSALIARNTGTDYGHIVHLTPIERGPSGRLIRLLIEGTRHRCIIGKELEIRRVLSATHLYSSAFVVDEENVQAGVPSRFVLHGAGWGHGVGLCQIGAAVMGSQGYDFRQILHHYYPLATLTFWYR